MSNDVYCGSSGKTFLQFYKIILHNTYKIMFRRIFRPGQKHIEFDLRYIPGSRYFFCRRIAEIIFN